RPLWRRRVPGGAARPRRGVGAADRRADARLGELPAAVDAGCQHPYHPEHRRGRTGPGRVDVQPVRARRHRAVRQQVGRTRPRHRGIAARRPLDHLTQGVVTMDMQADLAAPPIVPVADLRTGDVLLMMGEGPLSDLIAWASDSLYSHAAIVADAGDLIEAAAAGVRRYPLATRVADQVHYQFIDALRMQGPDAATLSDADGAAVLAKAVSLLGTPYPVDQLALFGAIMAVRGKWPEHPLGRLVVREALDHAVPDQTGSVVCSEVVYRAYAECAATPTGRLAPVIVVGERGTAPFPQLDRKALFDE